MGLPGSGKTFLARKLKEKLERYISVDWFNADEVRKEYNDWDFSREGRLRQSFRMLTLMNQSKADAVLLDLVAPLAVMRDVLDCDYVVWADTISEGRFTDTNQIFNPPTKYNVRMTTKDCEYWSDVIVRTILESRGIHDV